MIVNFDIFNKRRIPSLILCNPNGQELYSIPLAKSRELSISLNELSELTFELPKYMNKDEITPYYDMIKTRRVIKLEEVGQFIITNVEVSSDGVTEIKRVVCKGLEFELSSRNLDLLEGTYALYNIADQSKSLLHIIMKYIPNWSISEVDSELWDVWRTFNVRDNNIYNFLMGEVQEAFDCVFMFDTFKRTIKVVKTSNLPKKTDIYFSNRNLMKELNITENADNIITALDVYGDGDLSIRTVNPLATPTVYDFSHFATLEWMSQGLVTAINTWETKVKDSEIRYANLLVNIKNLSTQLTVLKNELNDLETELKALEQKHSLAVVAGDNANCTLYASQIKDKEAEINTKKNQIKTKEEEISSSNLSLSEISKGLSFENNFTVEQLKELHPFIYQASIQNTNYSITELTTIEEQRDIMYSLYEWGKSELRKSCQPIWEFSVSSVNFLNLIEYKQLSNQLNLGSEVTIEVDKEKDLFATAMLLGYTINLDNFDDLELKFSNVLRFKSGSYTFDELFDTTASISKSFDFESPSWNLGKEAKSKIDDYTSHALSLKTQEITSSENQEFTISSVGIRGKEYLPLTDSYSDEQIWMNKNTLAFSDDAFNTTKLALGKITLPDGTKAYGLIGDYIVGKVLCGKTLILENENSTFRVDGQGVFLKNANIVITNDSGTEESLTDKVANDLNTAISGVYKDIGEMNQAIEDGMIDIFYQGTPPKIAKEGDLWYDTSRKNQAFLYRSGQWVSIQDQKILDALADASKAQATADGKITSYYQATAPQSTADKKISEGDIWVNTSEKNKQYRYTSGKWQPIQDGAISDLASKTSQDLSNAVNDLLQSMADADQALADGMLETFYTATEPTEAKLGDLWFKTDTGKLYRNNGATTGNKWTLIEDAKITEAIDKAQNAQDTADGKITSYYTNTKPTITTHPNLSEGDIWVNVANGNEQHRYTNGNWVSIRDAKIGEISQHFTDAVNGLLVDIGDINQAIADGMIETFYQTATPIGKYGDLWFNTATGKLYRNNGQATNPWQLIEDAKITEAIDKAQSAQTTADGKITTYYLGTYPTTSTHPKLSEGDILIHTNEGFKQYRYTSGQWKPIQDKAISEVSKDLATAVESITTSMGDMETALLDKMIVTYYDTNQPTNGKQGDLWFNTSTGRVHRHNGTNWVLVEDKQLEQALRDAQNAQDTADKKIVSYYCTKSQLPTTSELGNGDLWFDTADKNHPHRWVGNAWESLRDGTISDAQNTANDALNKVTNIITESGEINTEKMQGHILAGKNNIDCINPTTNNALKINENGILIAPSKKPDGSWDWKTAISGYGIEADYIKANGTITSVNFKGGTLNLGDGKFTVSDKGACTATDLTITGGSIAIGNAFSVDKNGNISVSKGSINLGNGNFTVDTYGRVVATSIEISGQGSVLDAKDMTIRNLVVGGNVTMGANATISWANVSSKPNVATQEDIPTNSEITSLASSASRDVLSATYGITSTTIGQSSISSPNINGGTITGTSIIGGQFHQSSSGSNYADIDILGGYIQWANGGQFYGSLSVDPTDRKMYLQGGNALKLETVSGGISIQASSGNRVHIGDCQFMGSVTGCKVVFG